MINISPPIDEDRSGGEQGKGRPGCLPSLGEHRDSPFGGITRPHPAKIPTLVSLSSLTHFPRGILVRACNLSNHSPCPGSK
jgi:hypothetical protein